MKKKCLMKWFTNLQKLERPTRIMKLLKLKHLLNGALITDIVEKASSLAMHRDIDAKLTEATGVGLADLKTAVEQTVKEESVKNHENVVADLVGQMMRRATKGASKNE